MPHELKHRSKHEIALVNAELLPHVLQQPARAQAYVAAATADNTRRTYRSAIRQFEVWGGRLPTTQQQLSEYVVAKAQTISPRTLQLHVTAIRQWHRSQGLPTPTEGPHVQKLLKGITRIHAKPRDQAKALSFQQIKSLCDALDQQGGLKSLRDKALILLGFTGAFRRSELVSIDCSYLAWSEEGVVVTLPTSKTDALGEGVNKVIPKGKGTYCPVQTLEQWLERSATCSGAVFKPINRWGQVADKAMTPSAVNGVLKHAAKLAGLQEAEQFSGHSLRRGAATAAAKAGANLKQIKAMGGWRSDTTVWQYIEQGTQFDESAASVIFDS